jgi:hypothetical protein
MGITSDLWFRFPNIWILNDNFGSSLMPITLWNGSFGLSLSIVFRNFYVYQRF